MKKSARSQCEKAIQFQVYDILAKENDGHSVNIRGCQGLGGEGGMNGWST